jgi:amidase
MTPESIDRRAFVVAGLVGGAMGVAGAAVPALGEPPRPVPPPASPSSASPPSVAPPPDFDLAEATIDTLQRGMTAGTYTARSIVERYLARIDAVDKRGPAINAVIELNPEALAIADALDAERASKGPRGPMHGIPVLIKDNIATADRMQTTAGSLALVGSVPPRDAFIVERLRAAGAVILGKTNLSEWANFRSTHSTSGWSGRGGQSRNPYALDRNTSGSSAGSGAACSANCCTVAVGTETDGSIVSPSQCNSLVGIKPTVGLLSRAGIVPISHTQDTPGPMCRTVRDAAILLGAMVGVDARDAATAASHGHSVGDYTATLDPNGLKGARIGVPRRHFWGYSALTDAITEHAIDVLRRQGATIVDPADIPHAGTFDDAEQTVLLYDFKTDLNAYLADLRESPVRTMADVIAFNTAHHDAELPYFGQELLLQAESKGPLSSAEYTAALARCRRLSRSEGLDAVMAAHRLDAVIAATGGPPWLIDLVDGDYGAGGSTQPAAVAGYPSITVPSGYARGLPVGLSFMGRAWSEPTLLRLAYAFEQATRIRRPPTFLPTADLAAAATTP